MKDGTKLIVAVALIAIVAIAYIMYSQGQAGNYLGMSVTVNYADGTSQLFHSTSNLPKFYLVDVEGKTITSVKAMLTCKLGYSGVATTIDFTGNVRTFWGSVFLFVVTWEPHDIIPLPFGNWSVKPSGSIYNLYENTWTADQMEAWWGSRTGYALIQINATITASATFADGGMDSKVCGAKVDLSIGRQLSGLSLFNLTITTTTMY